MTSWWAGVKRLAGVEWNGLLDLGVRVVLLFFMIVVVIWLLQVEGYLIQVTLKGMRVISKEAGKKDMEKKDTKGGQEEKGKVVTDLSL